MQGFDWYPWTPIKYRRDTMHLSDMEDLIYRRLIDHYMETRTPLLQDDVALAKAASVSVETWKMASAKVLPYFRYDNGKLYHETCDQNLAEQGALSEKKSKAGKAGAEKRWGKASKKKRKNSAANGNANGTAMADPMANDSTIHNTTDIDSGDKSPSSPPPPNGGEFVLPDWIPKTDWDDYVSMRIRIRKPITLRAKNLTVSELEKLRRKGHDPAAVLQQSIQRSWQGVFEIKGELHGNRPQPKHTGFENQDYRAGTDRFVVS